jgi:hypothetical protein
MKPGGCILVSSKYIRGRFVGCESAAQVKGEETSSADREAPWKLKLVTGWSTRSTGWEM